MFDHTLTDFEALEHISDLAPVGDAAFHDASIEIERRRDRERTIEQLIESLPEECFA